MIESGQSNRFLIAIGYHGDAFHGSQIQPDVRTVEGSLVQALRRLNWWNKSCLELSSRTDSGVKVRMNLARIDLPQSVSSVIKEKSLVRALNDHLPVGMTVISARKVDKNSRVRFAFFRHYLYRLDMIEEWPEKTKISQITEACSIIEGTHNFSNLSRFEEEKDPVRTVDECIPWIHTGNVIGFSDGLILRSNNHPDFQLNEETKFPINPPFSTRRYEIRDYRRWISLCNFEMSLFIEREWFDKIT